MARVTPRIRAEGRYVLAPPWDNIIPPGVVFLCEAIRTIPELEQENIDVYTTYYSRFGVTTTAFKNDVKDGVCIITIISQDRNTIIHVPDSYILHCPTDNGVNQDHIVLSCSLGILPSYYNLTAIKTLIASKVLEVLGITTTVLENRAISIGSLSEADNDIAEAARETNRIFQRSPEAELRDANAKILDLQTRLDDAYSVMRDNDLIEDV